MPSNYIEPDLYKVILDSIPIPCVDISILHEGKILLVLRMDKPGEGEWWLPGGRVYKGEVMHDTAHRKALEEVGLDCHVGPIIHTAETIFPDGPNETKIHSINSCFFVFPKYMPISIKLDDHHTAYKWVTCVDKNLHPYVQHCLLAAGLDYMTPM